MRVPNLSIKKLPLLASVEKYKSESAIENSAGGAERERRLIGVLKIHV